MQSSGTVEVNHGNQHTAKQVMPSLWRYYDGLADQRKPALIRGDIFLGNEGFLVEAEKRNTRFEKNAEHSRHLVHLLVSENNAPYLLLFFQLILFDYTAGNTRSATSQRSR